MDLELLLLFFIRVFFYPTCASTISELCDRGWCPYYIYVYIYIYMHVDKKIFESHFSDQLTFSNIRSRISRRIYRLPLPLRAPETLFSLIESRIFLFNAHLTLFVRRMTSHNSIGKYRHLVN